MHPLIMTASLMGQVLLGGSTGADGAFAPQASQVLQVPDGGRFEFTTINIPAGVTITFERNARNDPVMLLATGAVTIAGVVDVSGEAGPSNRGGRGGPGGFDGGDPGFGQAGGSGKGPGGGHWFESTALYSGCSGAHSTKNSASNGEVYGSPNAIPLVGGSGGCGSNSTNGGGGGGGALLIASEVQLSLSGAIRARPGSYSSSPHGGEGAGGTIRVVAPKVVTTSSSAIDVSDSFHGGDGYIRIDAIDKTEIAGTRSPPSVPSYSVGSNMVVELPDMPRVNLLSAAGTQTNGQPFFATIPSPSTTSQPVEFELINFGGCADATVRVVPGTGAATKTPVPNVSTSEPVEVSVDIPGNTPTAIEVYAKSKPCPQ